MISVRWIKSMLFYLALVLLSKPCIFLSCLLGLAMTLCTSVWLRSVTIILLILILTNSSKMSCTQNVESVMAIMYTIKIQML